MEIKRRFDVVDDVSKQRTIVVEINRHFKIIGVQMHFSLLNKWCKEIGSQAMENILHEVEKLDPKYQPGLFIKKVTEQRKNILWHEDI